MAALEIDRSVVDPAFSSCNIVSLYCIERPLFLTWDSLEIVSVNLRFCHISMATSMRQRHWALIADRQEWGAGHRNFPAPKLIRVTSSCTVRWYDEDGDPSESPCIWEWEGITNIPPNIPTGDLTAMNMPELKQGNCSHCCPVAPTTQLSVAPRQPANSSVDPQQPSPSSVDPQQPSTSSVDPQQPSTSSVDPQQPTAGSHRDDSDEEVRCEAQIIKLKGSTFEERYQVPLKAVRKEMLERGTTDGRSSSVYLSFKDQ
ncbi:Hypp8339 [Branchiostoma lanceolatum]|uniref:Hypp8339 protein n=1 Tax=Branchiostoma lanceolatum TaxID=7740 RepID=A0A8J9Z893_BRALA|nr:Hypp8339 [Branchiostoma lanceolatum]